MTRTHGNENDRPLESCGEDVARSAVVPEQLAALMSHVADNLEAHARWVGLGSIDARREHSGMLQLAHDYRSIAAAALRAVSTMRSLRDLPVVSHDPEGWDRPAFMRWMRKKIDLQRAFAALILEHADVSERVLADLA